MISRKKWQVQGKALNIKLKQKGLWLTVKGVLSNDSYSQNSTIDCWLPTHLDNKKHNYYKNCNVSGVLVFKGKETYLIVEHVS